MELIPSSESYAELFLKWRAEERALRFNPMKDLTLDQVRARLRASVPNLAQPESQTEHRWFVESDGQVVGNAVVMNYNSMILTAEVGYTIAEEFAGRGLGAAAVRELVRMVFAQTQLRKLTATVHVENLASWKLLERVGFKREGLLREHFLIQGKPADEYAYGLLRSEFSTGAR